MSLRLLLFLLLGLSTWSLLLRGLSIWPDMRSWTRAALEDLRYSASTTPTASRAPPMRYECDVSTFPDWMVPLYKPLHKDEETQKFLEECEQVGLVAYAMTMVLRRFWSVTDVNGYVGAGQMFVFSRAQARHLLGLPPVYDESSQTESPAFESLLDIGAGECGLWLVSVGGWVRGCVPLTGRELERGLNRGS